MALRINRTALHGGRHRPAADIVAWLQWRGSYDHDEYVARPAAECVLNVAGSRESKADGMEDLAMAIMIDVLRAVNPECKGLYPVAG